MAERNELTSRTEFGESSRERSVDEIRQDIAARRETITETVDKLRNGSKITLPNQAGLGATV